MDLGLKGKRAIITGASRGREREREREREKVRKPIRIQMQCLGEKGGRERGSNYTLTIIQTE